MAIERRTLLAVDDDVEICNLIASEVDYLGYGSFIATDVKAALEILEREKIDAIICDIHMPGMSGIDLLSILRSRGCNIPLTFLTGFQNQDFLIKAIQLGAKDFLVKPYSISDLHSAIERILDMGARLHLIQSTFQNIIREFPEAKSKIQLIEKVHMQFERLRVPIKKKDD
jgi:DNA-binding NtrC family response regulator